MSGGRSLNTIKAGLARFLREEDGVLPALALIFFVVILAVGGLSIDLGRLYGVRGQMQSYVDHAALAGATQLDRSSTAIDRAFCAAVGGTLPDGTSCGPLIAGSNTQNIATVSGLSAERVMFMSKLSGSWSPGTATPVTGTDPDVVVCTWESNAWTPANCDSNGSYNNEAQFVEVRADTRTVSYVLLPLVDLIGALSGGPTVNSQDLQLSATAGYKQYLCNNMPIMICNPDEATNGPGADFDVDGRDDGKQIYAKLSGNSSSLAPGLFGLLSNDTSGNSASAMRTEFATTDPNTTCTSSTVVAKNGQATGPASQGLDVRFDMYQGAINPNSSNVAAFDVIKGLTTSGNCNNSRSAQTVPLPRDNCFMVSPTVGAGTGCVNVGGIGRMGDGNWARSAYWTTNHPGETWPPPGLSANATRYQVYQYEIQHPDPVNLDEKSGPVCNPPSGSYNAASDRRVFLVAVVNCVADASSIANNAALPVKAYANVFMTEPAGNTQWTNSGGTITRGGATWGGTTPDDIYVEIIGLAHPGDSSGKLHQFPVLYR